MKRIEFIAPVEAMRGNLSGNQSLKYAERNNPAWDAPEGVQAARNYTPRYVGAKISATGKKTFSVRTKAVIGLTGKTREAMALLAGSAACFLAASKTLTLINILQAAFLAAKSTDSSLTFRKWLQPIFYGMLASKQNYVQISAVVGGSTSTVKIGNPWVAPGPGVTGVTPLDISQDILVKFWEQLSVNGIVFTLVALGGHRVKGIAFANEPWETLCQDTEHNVLGLVADGGSVKYGDLFILGDNGDPIDVAAYILGKEYNLGTE